MLLEHLLGIWELGVQHRKTQTNASTYLVELGTLPAPKNVAIPGPREDFAASMSAF